VKDNQVPRDDVYKSGTIHVGQGESPNSQSRPTPRPKAVAAKKITSGKLLRPGGPQGGPSKLASRPAASRPQPAAARPMPGASTTQHRAVPQIAVTHPTQRATHNPIAAAINNADHARSDSASSGGNRAPPPPPPPAPPAAKPAKDTYKVLYDFSSGNSNELSIKKDEILEVLQKESNGQPYPVPTHSSPR
jgi:myosin I